MSSGKALYSLVKPNISFFVFYSIIVKSRRSCWDGPTKIYGAKHKTEAVNHVIDGANYVK